MQAAELHELEDARQKALINECAAVADKLARIQEPEQLEEMSACHVEEDAWQEANSEAGTVEQGTEAKYGQDRTCKAQAEGKTDLEHGRFGEYVKQLEERWSKLEDRLTAHVEAEIESRAAQWRDYMLKRQKVLDDDRASMVEQITAGSKKLKRGFETHAENLKDLLAQSCRAGMARLTDLEEKAEELEAELASQQDMEDRVSKLNTLTSHRLQNAADDCDSFRARLEHHESQPKTAMGDRTRIHDELRKLNDEAKNQSGGLRELEKRLRGRPTSCVQTSKVTNGPRSDWC